MTIPPRVRIGLVLGAGGVVGQAYQFGVLAVLENDCGFDAGDADVIVGTSAGEVTGMLLRLGVAPGDLAAWMVKAPLAEEHEVLRRMAEMAVPEFVLAMWRRGHPEDVIRKVVLDNPLAFWRQCARLQDWPVPGETERKPEKARPLPAKG